MGTARSRIKSIQHYWEWAFDIMLRHRQDREHEATSSGGVMGRLIDANAFYKRYCETYEDGVDEGEIARIAYMISTEPTAYDTENVIEQLNDLPTFKVSATSEKHPFSAYESEMISKHKVMGIVKKGGAE